MKNFTTVIQTGANKFDVFKFNAESSKAACRKGTQFGVIISCRESNNRNDKYCFELAEKMNTNIVLN